jgi:PAS domain S-box-containing protein
MRTRLSQLERDFEERTRQLRESQIKYKEIIDNAHDIIAIIQRGRLKFVSPNALELTEYSSEELMDVPFMDLIHDEDRVNIGDAYERFLNK